VFQFANRLEAACGVLAKRTMPVGLGPTGGTGFALGVCFAQAQEGVFHESRRREGGQPAGFVDGQQMGVFKQDFEVLRGVWFDPGGRFQTRVWPKVTDSLPVTVTPLR